MEQIEAGSYNYWFFKGTIKQLRITNYSKTIDTKNLKDTVLDLFKYKNYYPTIEEVKIINK